MSLSTSERTSGSSSMESILRAAGGIVLELIEADRALPVLEEDDYRRIRYYVQHFVQVKNGVADGEGVVSLSPRGGPRAVAEDRCRDGDHGAECLAAV